MMSRKLWRQRMTLLVGSLVIASSIYSHSLAQQDSAEIASDFIEMGLDVFDFAHRKQARELFTNAIMYDHDNAFAHFMVGQSIMLTVHREESLPYFLTAYDLDPKVNDSILFMIGKAYHYTEEFTKAIEYYQLHKQELARSLDFGKAREIDLVNRKIFECRNGLIFKAHPVDVEITNLGDKVNTEFPEYAPAIRADEMVLMFTSRREDNVNPNLADDHAFYEDVYISNFEDGNWQAAVNIGAPINTLYHNASIGLSPDGKELFLYSDDNGGDVMVSFMDDQGSWSEPVPIRGEVNTEYLESSATITNDRQTLYFTSNRPGGLGGTDIWSSQLSPGGRWKAPVNQGALINTEFDEDGAFISSDGQHLYFSSYGHYGMGDLDIYRSERNKDKLWTEPLNLGYPINSVEDDIYFVLSGDEKHAYYSSVKFDSWGSRIFTKLIWRNTSRSIFGIWPKKNPLRIRPQEEFN